MMLAHLVLLFLISMAECQSYDRPLVESLKNDLNIKIWRRANGGDFKSLFNFYDPSFLSVVWPKIRNGIHLLVNLECWNDVTVFFRELSEGKAWAYDMVDASGRYPSSLFSGRKYWFGSKQQCLKMSNDYLEFGHNETLAALRNNEYVKSILKREKYVGSEEEEWRWMMQEEVMQQLLAQEHRPPYALIYNSLQITLNITKFTLYKSYDITLGVCLPRSCASDDVESIISLSISLSDHLRSNRMVPRRVAITSLRQIDGSYDWTSDTGAIIIITVTVALLTLAIIATVIDLNLCKCFPYSKKSMSFDLPKHSNELSLVDELKRKHTEIMNVELSTDPTTVVMKKVSAAPPVTLDVASGSCKRCGKYRRQCPNARQATNLPACPRVKYNSFASLSTEDKRNTFCCRLLLCFSVTYNLKRIFNKNTANKDLSTVHFLKIFATLWIIFVHVAVVASYASNNGGDLNKREDVYYILTTGTIAFDTLFFVSGAISSYHLFYLKSRYSVRELVSFGGTCGHIMQYVCFVTNRIIRLVPSYAYILVTAGVVARWAGTTRGGALPDAEHETCSTGWWRNVLYVTNLYPAEERCVLVSWFLTLETQLHAAAALLCVWGGAGGAGGARGRLAAAGAGALALAALAADLSEALLQEDITYSSSYALYYAVIERGWARVAPYMCGVAVGALLHRNMHHTLTANKVVSCLVWSASVSLCVSSLGGAAAGGAGSRWWVHASWPLALFCPVILLCTKYAHAVRGLCSWVWLSRLSGGMLLSHSVVVRLLLVPDKPLCSDMICISEYFVWVSSVSVVCALCVCVFIEMPVCALLRRLSESATT